MRRLLGLGDLHADEARDAGRGRSGSCGARRGTAPATSTSEGSPPQRSRIIRVASSMPERGEGRVDAALEAVAGVGVDPQPAAGAGGADRIELGGLDEDVGGRLGAAGAQAAHDAADRLGAVGVADERSRSRRRRSPCRRARASVSPGRARRTVIGAVELVGVEDVQRPVAVVGDEVGDVDERRDRAEADGAQAVLQPLRRGAVPDAADQAADEERAGLAGDVGGEVDARPGRGRRRGRARRRASRGVPRPRAARSRAMPATPRASGRFGVMATSMTGSKATTSM